MPKPTTFKHPADAMRAQIAGELNCMFCIYRTPIRELDFCNAREDDPMPEVGTLYATVCEKFEHK